MGSKIDNLEFLKEKTTLSKTLPLKRFAANTTHAKIIQEVQESFKTNIIIRSSASNEDTKQTSQAGHYDSVLDVDISCHTAISHAIDTVVNSYSNIKENDEIFVQPMLQDTQVSGVVFTADLNTLAQYYIINYEQTDKTDTVTSGSSKNAQTYIHYKNSNIPIENPFIGKLIDAIKEIEQIFENSALDIEFASDGKDIYIFQVRPIVKTDQCKYEDITLDTSLAKLQKKLQKLSTPHPDLLGQSTMFGVMPDWNPAEIIGKKPKALSLSLYKELVTNNVWAYQRDKYGYRDLKEHPILISLLGVAYIDVRVSFNSFIPKTLDDEIADKLVNHYLDTLYENPHLHDKVEFEIIHSCFDFSTEEKIDHLEEYGFSQIELHAIKKALKDLTNNIFSLYKEDMERIKQLLPKYNKIKSSNLALINKIDYLNKLCKNYGTLPFAGIARSAFVAISFLKSFVQRDILSQARYNAFLLSINTVSKQLSLDLHRLTKEEFLKLYGHLRPGTYDILSKRYDEEFENYFKHTNPTTQNISFSFTKQELEDITYHLEKNGIKIGTQSLIQFITDSIEAREYAKLTFTQVLSHILQLIEQLGQRVGISTHDLAYLDYSEVLNLYDALDTDDVKDIFLTNIAKNKKAYQLTKTIKLPDLLRNQQEIYSYTLAQNSANYISLEEAQGEIVCEELLKDISLNNSIACIRSADPGYDFIFTKGVAGLITCYGGANSHMAIRCAELNIPAVIGVGEQEFNKILNASVININCKTQNIKIIS